MNHLPSFCYSLVLTCSGHQKRKKKEKVADNISGFDLYLLIEQLAVLPQIRIISLLVHALLASKSCLYTCSFHGKCSYDFHLL